MTSASFVCGIEYFNNRQILSLTSSFLQLYQVGKTHINMIQTWIFSVGEKTLTTWQPTSCVVIAMTNKDNQPYLVTLQAP